MKVKVFNIIILSVIILFGLSTKALANFNKIYDIDGVKIAVKDVTQPLNPSEWRPSDLTDGNDNFNKIIGTILNAIQNFGIVASVISLMIIGARTMYGSLEEKSHYRELLPTFLIGVFILFSCTTLPNIIYQIASKFNDV